MTDMDDDVQPLEPGLCEQASDRFRSLKTLDLTSVRVSTLRPDGFAVSPAGRSPADGRLGEPCGTRSCPYALNELSLVRNVGDVADRMLRDIPARWEIDPREVLVGLRLDVFKVSAKHALRFADLRTHPILYRVPLSPEWLQRTGAAELAPDAVGWELVRILRDAKPGIDGIILPPASGSAGQDLLVFSDGLRKLSFTRIGAIQDTIPTVTDSHLANLLQRLISRGNVD